MGAAIDHQPDFMSNRGDRELVLLGRLRHGVSLQQAQAGLNVTAQRLAQQYSDIHKNLILLIFPETRGDIFLIGSGCGAAGCLFIVGFRLSTAKPRVTPNYFDPSSH
jgi:hypothetical protein